jgi:hypothetical protein
MRLSDEHLAASVRAAFEALPEPDATRLKEVEERLVRPAARRGQEKKSRIGYWWLMAALAASGAAAWWAGDLFNTESPKQHSEQRLPVATEVTERGRVPDSKSGEGERPANAGPPNMPGNSREIYRREAY